MRSRHESGLVSLVELKPEFGTGIRNWIVIRSSRVTTSPPRQPIAPAIDAKAKQDSSQELEHTLSYTSHHASETLECVHGRRHHRGAGFSRDVSYATGKARIR